jgi:uncharacterized protein (TIGR02147 family)
MIYHLNSVSEVIGHHLNVKRDKNESYSLRAFARDLSISASHLSQVISGKKMLSADKLVSIQKKMNLSLEETTYFKLLVDYEQSREEKNCLSIKEDIEKIRQRYKVQVEEADSFHLISDWYHVAILELACRNTQGISVEEISGSLYLEKYILNSALERLLRLQLIEERGRRFFRTNTNLAFRCDNKNLAFAKYNLQMCELAKLSILDTPVEDRVISTQTFAMNESLIPEAKKLIREFGQRMTDLFYKSEDREKIYHLNVHFFPLDETILKKDSKDIQ